MSTEDDRIEQYLKDPMSMPEGEELSAFLAGEESQEGKPDAQSSQQSEQKKDETAAGAAPGTTDKPQDDSNKPGEPDKSAVEDPDKSVVVSKDGKHEIPYSVLAAERENRVRAERMAKDLNDQLEALKQAKEAGTDVKSSSVADLVDQDALAELREESPTMADAIDKLLAQVVSLQGEVSKVTPLAEETRREAEIQSQLTVEEAIAAVPKLAYIRTNDPAAFNDIAALDTSLRAQPKWQGKPMQERFDAAVRMYEAANGAIELPTDPKKSAATPADNAKKVDAAINKALASAKGPNTLSDIPGGGLPATDELASAEEMSGSQLTVKFESMTQDQQDAFLARMT